jgi:hypothetical protein
MNEEELFGADGEGFTVNVAEVAKCKDMLAVTRLLAMELMKTPYMSVGDFMKNLSDQDLHTLLEIGDNHENEHFQEMILISEMLASSEGVPGVKSLDETQERIGLFITFIAIEGLARKGLVRVYRENMSFGEDMSKLIVAEKID